MLMVKFIKNLNEGKMKKYLGLISFVCIMSFGANLEDNIVGWLVNVAKKPAITSSSSFSSDVKMPQGMIELSPAFLNLVATSDFSRAIELLNSNSLMHASYNTNLCNEVELCLNNAELAENIIKDLSPSTSLPLFFQILEEGSFGTNEIVELYENWHEGDEEELIGVYSSLESEEINIKKGKMNIYPLVGSYICDKLNVLTESKDWYLTEIWVKYIPPGVNNKCPPATCHFPYFWWYEGRKYATNIWSDFYRCWQYEQARTTPREGVLDQLAKEIAELGICAIPIVKDAIDGGDNTLAPVLKALAVKLGEGGLTNQSFSSWYSENASKYILPPCEGLEAAKLGITDTNYVNELNGIMNLGQPGHKTVRTYDGYANFMNVFRAEMSAYYTNRPAVPDYWYYKLPDDVLEFDASVAYDLDRNCTNFNPRYLIPSN